MILSKKRAAKITAIALAVVMVVTGVGYMPLANSTDNSNAVHAASSINIIKEIEKYASDSDVVLEGFSRKLSENHGPRLYGTKLQKSGAEFFISEMKKTAQMT